MLNADVIEESTEAQSTEEVTITGNFDVKKPTIDWFAIEEFKPESEKGKSEDKYVQQLHLFTNSTLWSILPYSTLFLFFVLCLYIFKYVYIKEKIDKNSIPFQIFILLMIVMNIAPFILIERPQFLYHAFDGVLFAILGLGMLLNSLYLLSRNIRKEYQEYISYTLWVITIFVTVLLIFFFITTLPLIYGFSFHDSMAHTMFQLF